MTPIPAELNLSRKTSAISPDQDETKNLPSISLRDQLLRAQSPKDWAIVAETVAKFGNYGRAGQYLEEVAKVREAIDGFVTSLNEKEKALGLRLRDLMDPPKTSQDQ